jgi:hypothetical protein
MITSFLPVAAQSTGGLHPEKEPTTLFSRAVGNFSHTLPVNVSIIVPLIFQSPPYRRRYPLPPCTTIIAYPSILVK